MKGVLFMCFVYLESAYKHMSKHIKKKLFPIDFGFWGGF
jgi:hypothetical protein